MNAPLTSIYLAVESKWEKPLNTPLSERLKKN